MVNKPKVSNDKQNLERDVHLRYCTQSGQSSIHGDTLYELQTQEAQSFAFYSGTGQGGTGKGPGTGKCVLYTPGSSTEVLGEGLKVRDAGDVVQLPAKIIKCKRGDTIIECENGDIVLRGRNITIDATGGGQDGVVNIVGSRIVDVDAPDIRLQGEKITERATKDFIMISEGFTEMKSAFTIAATKADEQFGAMAKVLEETTSILKPKVGEATQAIKKKVEDSGLKDKLRDVAEGFIGGL